MDRLASVVAGGEEVSQAPPLPCLSWPGACLGTRAPVFHDVPLVPSSLLW